MGLEANNYKSFANIVSKRTDDCKKLIRVRTEEENPDAVKREIINPVDGTKKIKFELAYDSLSGIISNIRFHNSVYGKSLQITVDDIVLSINVENTFAEDIMKKLPNIDLSKEVKFTPYPDFKNRTTNKIARRGVTIYQNKQKIKNFFYNPETKENLHNFPLFPENYKDLSKEEWNIYFSTCRQFLIKYLEENILPKFENVATTTTTQETETQNEMQIEESVDGEIKVDEIPFDDPEPETPASAQTEATTKVVSTEAMEAAIANFAKTKLKVEKDEDVQRVVMENLGIAYIPSNFNTILEKLKNL